MAIDVPRWVPTFRQITPSGELHPSYFLTFPVNPERYRIEHGRGLEELSIIGYRDVPRLGSRRLDKISFTALLPGSYQDGICNYEDIPSSHFAYNRLRRWSQGSGVDILYPLRVTIAGLYSDTMVLTDVTLETQPNEETDDLWVTVSLVQWFDLKPKAWSYARPNRQPARLTSAKRYTVVSGDTLWGIARRHYGKGTEWRRIWEANKPMTSGNPDLIYPGEVILLPKG